jgi:hypothetical protein
VAEILEMHLPLRVFRKHRQSDQRRGHSFSLDTEGGVGRMRERETISHKIIREEQGKTR